MSTYWVAAAIANEDKSWFFVQQKDGKYPIPRYRYHFSFFGGGSENGEDEDIAIRRELMEEIPDGASLIIKNLERKFEDKVTVMDGPIRLVLYESILSSTELVKLSRLPVTEGIGHLRRRSDVEKLPYVFGFGDAVQKYLSKI